MIKSQNTSKIQNYTCYYINSSTLKTYKTKTRIETETDSQRGSDGHPNVINY